MSSFRNPIFAGLATVTKIGINSSASLREYSGGWPSAALMFINHSVQ
jgi:hypothetical protein